MKRIFKIITITDIILIIVGSSLLALALNLFLRPLQLVTGGVGGLGIIMEGLYNIPVDITIYIGNAILFIVGWVFLGNKFAIKTFLGSLFYPIAVSLTKNITVPEIDPILAVIYGAVVAGIGLGLIFRKGGSTGGTDIPPQIFRKYFGLSISTGVLMVDTPILLFGGLIFGFEKILYSLISLYLTSIVIDRVIIGFSNNKAVYIFSDYYRDISDLIIKKYDRSVTLLDAEGGFSGKKKPTVLCVMSTRQYTKLKVEIDNIDPTAFMIIMNASEVHGEGFTRAKLPLKKEK